MLGSMLGLLGEVAISTGRLWRTLMRAVYLRASLLMLLLFVVNDRAEWFCSYREFNG
jgi:hypothetical protein